MIVEDHVRSHIGECTAHGWERPSKVEGLSLVIKILGPEVVGEGEKMQGKGFAYAKRCRSEGHGPVLLSPASSSAYSQRTPDI